MRSLVLKLTLAFLVVGLAGAVLVAAFVGDLTRREFDRFVVDRYHYEVLSEVADYYANNGSWDGLQRVLRPRRGPGGQGTGGNTLPPISIQDNDGLVVFSNLPGYEVGTVGAGAAGDGICCPSRSMVGSSGRFALRNGPAWATLAKRRKRTSWQG